MDKDWLSISWKVLVARGAAGVVFGAMAMVWPISTAIALALLWGIWAFVEGVGMLVQAFQREATGRVWLALMGIVSLIAAFFAIFSPEMAAVTLTWILGIWLIVRGVFELVGSVSSTRRAPRWLLVVSALLSLVLGVLFVVNPGSGAVVIAFWLGLAAFCWGIAFIVLGLITRNGIKTMGPLVA